MAQAEDRALVGTNPSADLRTRTEACDDHPSTSGLVSCDKSWGFGGYPRGSQVDVKQRMILFTLNHYSIGSFAALVARRLCFLSFLALSLFLGAT